SHQQVQIISISSTDGTLAPAAIVGSRVTLPAAGQYELYFVFPLDREQQTLRVVGRTLSLGGIALVLLLGGVAYVVTRIVVDPVRRAALVAERLSSGRLHERMRAHGEDDIARLGKAFNAMADSLQKQIRQLEDLSRVQQRFVSDVSHELRTPLTTIRMAGDLIHESRHDFDPSVARSAELLHNEVDRFESLLSDLLEISRFDAGAAALDVEATDLRNTIVRTIESTAPLAARRGSRLEVIPTDGPCVADIDPRRVERILRNLVANAIEYGEGRPVTVQLGVNAKAVAVSVCDSGVGLRPGEAALVFNRFWRSDPARARTTGGTGLGLAISREDARLHGGWLHAWGEPAVGSCFRLTLPRHTGVPIESSPLPLKPQDERSTRSLASESASNPGAASGGVES
ncbi:MAG TPA: MtrAB system histidine kinase MtrB, partial [Dermatophilaceae bacterium]